MLTHAKSGRRGLRRRPTDGPSAFVFPWFLCVFFSFLFFSKDLLQDFYCIVFPSLCFFSHSILPLGRLGRSNLRFKHSEKAFYWPGVGWRFVFFCSLSSVFLILLVERSLPSFLAFRLAPHQSPGDRDSLVIFSSFRVINKSGSIQPSDKTC